MALVLVSRRLGWFAQSILLSVGLVSAAAAQTTTNNPVYEVQPPPTAQTVAAPSAEPAPSKDVSATAQSSGATQVVDGAAPSALPTKKTAATYTVGDLTNAAERALGQGAKGLAEIIQKVLAEQGEPNAYITGSEGAGAFILGVRYGAGTLNHKVEGVRQVYWTGPSVGLDVGGDANRLFVLVYNLYDSQDLYRRYAQVEGRAYFVGGLSATYLRRGNVVLVPIRVGAGVRLGANVGYMKFREKAPWFPF
jgi:hypothetical protein